MSPQCYKSLDDVQLGVLSQLLTEGSEVSPRGAATLESLAVSFALLDPRRRCILNPQRRWSLPLALGELCWHLSGSTAAHELFYYAPGWQSFADSTGNIRGSCYGSKIFANAGGSSPWVLARRLLQADPDSRRAILYFGDPLSHLALDCKDAACAVSLQFMIRDGVLDALVCMRSNDAIWGLPYDVFLFTFLQELMALSLGISLGTYYHYAASLHLYARHRGLASRVLESGSPSTFAMPPMKDTAAINKFLDFERRIRADEKPPLLEGVDEYWQDLAEVLRLFQSSRRIGWSPTLRSAAESFPYGTILAPLAQERLQRIA